MKSEKLEGIIRGLLNYEARPDGIGPTEITVVIALVVKGALEKPVLASNVTLGMAIGAADSTVKRAMERLGGEGVRWIEKQSGRGRSNSNRYTVLLDRLPVAEEVKRTVINDRMRTLAVNYAKFIKPYGKKGRPRRFTKANYQRMAFCLQQFLARCDGDEVLLVRIVNFAVTDPRYRSKAIRGPHFLRRDFAKMLAEVKQKSAESPSAKEAA